mgnify:FL=1
MIGQLKTYRTAAKNLHARTKLRIAMSQKLGETPGEKQERDLSQASSALLSQTSHNLMSYRQEDIALLEGLELAVERIQDVSQQRGE